MKDDKCPTCKGSGTQGVCACPDCGGSGSRSAYEYRRRKEEYNNYPLPDPDEDQQLGGA